MQNSTTEKNTLLYVTQSLKVNIENSLLVENISIGVLISNKSSKFNYNGSRDVYFKDAK